MGEDREYQFVQWDDNGMWHIVRGELPEDAGDIPVWCGAVEPDDSIAYFEEMRLNRVEDCCPMCRKLLVELV